MHWWMKDCKPWRHSTPPFDSCYSLKRLWELVQLAACREGRGLRKTATKCYSSSVSSNLNICLFFFIREIRQRDVNCVLTSVAASLKRRLQAELPNSWRWRSTKIWNGLVQGKGTLVGFKYLSVSLSTDVSLTWMRYFWVKRLYESCKSFSADAQRKPCWELTEKSIVSCV